MLRASEELHQYRFEAERERNEQGFARRSELVTRRSGDGERRDEDEALDGILRFRRFVQEFGVLELFGDALQGGERFVEGDGERYRREVLPKGGRERMSNERETK